MAASWSEMLVNTQSTNHEQRLALILKLFRSANPNQTMGKLASVVESFPINTTLNTTSSVNITPNVFKANLKTVITLTPKEKAQIFAKIIAMGIAMNCTAIVLTAAAAFTTLAIQQSAEEALKAILFKLYAATKAQLIGGFVGGAVAIFALVAIVYIARAYSEHKRLAKMIDEYHEQPPIHIYEGIKEEEEEDAVAGEEEEEEEDDAVAGAGEEEEEEEDADAVAGEEEEEEEEEDADAVAGARNIGGRQSIFPHNNGEIHAALELKFDNNP